MIEECTTEQAGGPRDPEDKIDIIDINLEVYGKGYTCDADIDQLRAKMELLYEQISEIPEEPLGKAEKTREEISHKVLDILRQAHRIWLNASGEEIVEQGYIDSALKGLEKITKGKEGLAKLEAAMKLFNITDENFEHNIVSHTTGLECIKIALEVLEEAVRGKQGLEAIRITAQILSATKEKYRVNKFIAEQCSEIFLKEYEEAVKEATEGKTGAQKIEAVEQIVLMIAHAHSRELNPSAMYRVYDNYLKLIFEVFEEVTKDKKGIEKIKAANKVLKVTTKPRSQVASKVGSFYCKLVFDVFEEATKDKKGTERLEAAERIASAISDSEEAEHIRDLIWHNKRYYT